MGRSAVSVFNQDATRRIPSRADGRGISREVSNVRFPSSRRARRSVRLLHAQLNTLLEELSRGVNDWATIERLVIRLIAAMFLGAIIGFQRERAGKAAGLRTHMLVAMGSALFVLGCSAADMSNDAISRVVQGIATGLGFIGAGAIMKMSKQHHIEGLTTAAGIWLTAAAGVAAGLGRIGLAFVAVVFTWLILAAVRVLEPRIRPAEPKVP